MFYSVELDDLTSESENTFVSANSQKWQMPSATPNDAIGTVITIEEMHTPNFFKIHFRIKPEIPTLSSGTMVSILSKNVEGRMCYVICRVINAWEHNPHEDAMSSNLRDVLPIATQYAGEGESTVIFRIVESEPLEESELDEHGNIANIHEVRTLPRAGSPVYIANENLVIGTLGLRENPNDGLHVGLIKGTETPVVLPKETIQRHMFIGGGIGSGKSYTRGVLAEELSMLGIPQINIDINGELVDATKELGGLNLEPGISFTVPLSALTADDVINACPSLGGNMVDLVRHAHEELLKESAKTGKFFLVDDLVKKIQEVGPELDMKTQTIKPATARAQSLSRIKYIGKPYEWETELKPGRIININCKGLLVSDLRIITAAVARDIQRLAMSRKIPFVVLSIDEFHLVAPAKEETVALQVLREIARIGRHYRIGLLLTTQSPQDVDRSILKRLLTRFLHAIEPDQLDALRGVFADASEDLVKQLPKFPQGTCIITGAFETVRHAVVAQIRKRKTTHGGKTPDIWSELEEQGWSGKRPLLD